MRKIMARIILIAGAGVLVSGIALGAPMSVKVKNITGKVETQSGSAWKTVSEGESISVGAALRTGPASTCVIVWAGGNTAKLAPLTNMKIAAADKDASGKESTNINISQGKIVAHAKKLPSKDSSFKVSTPTAVAGVRGTDEVIEVSQGGESSFGVTEGSVELESGGETVVLEEGFMLDVDSVGSMTEPEAIPPQMMEELKEDLKEVNEEAKQAEAEAGGSATADTAKEQKKENEESAKEDKKESAAGGGDKGDKKEDAATGGGDKKEDVAAGGGDKKEEADAGGGDKKEDVEAGGGDKEDKEEPAAAESESDSAGPAEAEVVEVDMDAATANIDSAMDTAVNSDVADTAATAGEDAMITGDVDVIIDFITPTTP